MKLIPLHGLNGDGKFALVDDCDFEYLNQFKWYASALKKYNTTFYAWRSLVSVDGKRIVYKMHREISGVLNNSNVLIDHRDTNGLNNQRYNLRKCDAVKNGMNRRKITPKLSLYKGVTMRSYITKKGKIKWMARITVNKKLICLGYFDTQKEAAKIYDKKAKELFGEFANLNFKNTE